MPPAQLHKNSSTNPEMQFISIQPALSGSLKPNHSSQLVHFPKPSTANYSLTLHAAFACFSLSNALHFSSGIVKHLIPKYSQIAVQTTYAQRAYTIVLNTKYPQR